MSLGIYLEYWTSKWIYVLIIYFNFFLFTRVLEINLQRGVCRFKSKESSQLKTLVSNRETISLGTKKFKLEYCCLGGVVAFAIRGCVNGDCWLNFLNSFAIRPWPPSYLFWPIKSFLRRKPCYAGVVPVTTGGRCFH